MILVQVVTFLASVTVIQILSPGVVFFKKQCTNIYCYSDLILCTYLPELGMDQKVKQMMKQQW
jgi:hypothetical protein